ncbi:hypothetical protein C3747_78g110 [Trypanosoma cruzi]|uniref:CSD domain-containing protein n=2 Tax=Trypanosoma cruzi TaxID=5693 RepID=Q4E5R3_TRYCC|nr:hypothetical protein, conserved [Trypanosoma cruzi]EAO00094.1 hypothetical protein, conserved [Trypanosoma cruzi]PWV09526.1 hypothetical protein C3747_78g110 [Trypanosoma cruzi]RNC59996.1 hypothetical protein TcCL_ESM02336 [Trypanosoma cruzi]|eukprot:XP_821945.1 hypothetical protein [Trypanosoma cruzi strain CL Brener]
MSNTTRLTSRNLFDAVFATIPADVVLDTGPDSLRERCALMESRRAAAAAAAAESDDENNKDNNGEEEEKRTAVERKSVVSEEGFLFGSFDASTNTGVMDVSAMMRHAAAAKEEAAAVASMGDVLLRPVLDVQLDADDEAVQEATKYAALFVEDDEEHEEAEKAGNESKEKEEGVTSGADASRSGDPNQRQRQQQQYKKSMANASAFPSLTAEEQIVIMRPEEGIRHEGRCVLFRNSKGFGFVAPEVGGPDIYFTRDDVAYFFTRRVLEEYYGGSLLNIMNVRDASWRAAGRGGGGGGAGGGGMNGGAVSVLGAFPSTAAAPVSHNVTPCDVEEGEKVMPDANEKGGDEEGDTDRKQKEENKSNDKNDEDAELIREVDNNANSLVQQAAALLTPENARLLLLFLQVGKPILSVPEPVSFTVRWNRMGSHSSRRLRADNIRGLPGNGYALMVEQAWFERIFPRAFGRSSGEKGCKSKEGEKDDCLLRHRGTIRMYDADELRGVIRPDENGMQGVSFTGDAFLWDPFMDPARRRPSVGLVVHYSIAGRDRHGKYIATLITATDDTAISEANTEWASGGGVEDPKGREQGGEGIALGGGGVGGCSGTGGGGGGGHGRDEETAGRKRRRDEELLLLEEDDYGII